MIASEIPSEIDTPSAVETAKILKQINIEITRRSHESNNGGAAAEKTLPSDPPALILALFGWQAEESGHVSGVVTCNACFRRLGLWLFKPPPGTDELSGDSAMTRLDVVAEHRDYCPWVNAVAQNGSKRRASIDSLAGWQTLLRTLSSRSVSFGAFSSNTAPTEQEAILPDSSGSRPVDVFDRGQLEDDEEAEKLRTAKDKARWAKLKRVSQVFRSKMGKKPGGNSSSRPSSRGTTTSAA